VEVASCEEGLSSLLWSFVLRGEKKTSDLVLKGIRLRLLDLDLVRGRACGRERDCD